MAGRGTFADLRARLGVPAPAVPLAPSEFSDDSLPTLADIPSIDHSHLEPVSPTDQSDRSPGQFNEPISSRLAPQPSSYHDAHSLVAYEVASPKRLQNKAQQPTGPQGRRKRKGPRAEAPGTVFAACVGSAFDLHRMVSQWQLGTSVAFGLSKLVNRMEFLTEKADYPVLHGVIPSEYSDRDVDLFVMEFGCVVVWNSSSNQLSQIIDAVWPFLHGAKDKRSDVWVDDLNFTLPSSRVAHSLSSVEQNKGVNHDGNNEHNQNNNNDLLSYIEKDNILLATDGMMETLAYSYAFAQSVKLDVFERGVSRIIEGMDDFPAHMAKSGTVKVSDRRRVAKKIGELMAHGCDVNLKSDVLEIPDILWDMDIVLPVYHLSRKYLDIEARLEIVNHKLTVMQEMYAMIQEELTAAHNVRIEWIIIILIFVNIVIEIVMMALEWATR